MLTIELSHKSPDKGYSLYWVTVKDETDGSNHRRRAAGGLRKYARENQLGKIALVSSGATITQDTTESRFVYTVEH